VIRCIAGYGWATQKKTGQVLPAPQGAREEQEQGRCQKGQLLCYQSLGDMAQP
jgi:hypothetical protein